VERELYAESEEGSPLGGGGNTTRGGRGTTARTGIVGGVELVLIMLLFAGLALLAAVPLVALLHFSDHR